MAEVSLTNYLRKYIQSNKTKTKRSEGLPWWLSGKESTCQCRKMQVQSLAQEDPTVRGVTKLMNHNHWPVLEGPEPKLPRPHAQEPVPAAREAGNWRGAPTGCN